MTEDSQYGALQKKLTTYGSKAAMDTNCIRAYSSLFVDNYRHDTDQATGVKISTDEPVGAHLAL